MIHTFCILQKMTFSAFHYLTLSVRCEELDAHINYIYFWKAHTVNTFWRNFINIWGGADFGPYSSQSFDRLIGTYTSPYWKSGISTTSVRNSVFSRVERSGTSGKTLNFSHEWKKSQIFNKDECKYLFLLFQLEKKICAERREARTFLGYFVWQITILRQKIIFFPILGGRAPGAPPPPPGSAPVYTLDACVWWISDVLLFIPNILVIHIIIAVYVY
jgi:hypothetical protein